jgi:hypothetical protein
MRRRLLHALGGSLLILLPLGYWYCIHRPLRQFYDWSANVKSELRSLATRRPATVPPGEWEFLVGWTLHLHDNCAFSPRSITNDDLRFAFTEELRNRLQGEISVETIEWIWSQYRQFTRLGPTYHLKYNPLHSPDRYIAEVGHFGLNVR